MIKINKWIKGFIISFALATTLILSFSFTSQGDRYFEIVKNLDLFATLFKEVNTYYVDEINPSQLLNKGVEEMLGDLDPYTVYISEDKIEDFRTLNTGQYAGIGASTVTIDNKTFVSMVYKGFSAYEEGLQIGDEIIQVDGVKIDGLSPERFTQLVKGQAKSKVEIGVKKPGSDKLTLLHFVREKVSIPNVPYSGMLDNQIGYIKFTEFTPNGYKNVKKALQGLLKEDAEGIILDLRNNLGGLLKEAVDISNLFLPPGLEIVHTKGKVSSRNFTSRSKFNPLAPDIPLVVLVNNMSASASEIVAGTLQDYDRAVLIGQKTYGKGLVQNTRDLPYNSKVKMTIAKYYISSGRCIQAVDYAHRNADGSVGKMPDSLKVAFKTKSGRTVYDGGGIDPEIILEDKLVSELTRQLVIGGYIFKYASIYKMSHSEIETANKFNLNDDDFDHFSSWLNDTKFVYSDPLLLQIERLEERAKKIKKEGEISDFINKLSDKLKIPLVDALESNKNEIKRLLEVDIASHYYLEPGAVEAGLGDDPSITAAVKILKSPEEYKKLLVPVKK